MPGSDLTRLGSGLAGVYEGANVVAIAKHRLSSCRSCLSVQGISPHSAPDLHVRKHRLHSAQASTVRDYLD